MQKLQKGEPDWHQIINDNFEEVNKKVTLSDTPPDDMKEGAIWYKPIKDLTSLFNEREVIAFGNLGNGLNSKEEYKLIEGEGYETNN